MTDIGDLIQSTEVYECFDGNAVEVEIMLDYLGTQHISPRHIYSQVSVSPLAPEIFCPFSDKPLIDRAAYPVAAARICATD
jgi:E3 ubiquitin-protein ligase CHFR